MSSMPRWFEQLRWSPVWSVGGLAADRGQIPATSGCYVFTETAAGLRPNHVLYVGKAKNLRRRLGGYLVDFRGTSPTTHKGRAFIFEQRDRVGDHAVFVRWVEFGGSPETLESNLCDFLWPVCTDRWESQELWDDTEAIDPRLLG